ncbi:MAG: hypothetical protein ACK5Y2_03645 [Bdellovibrionales bacterium]
MKAIVLSALLVAASAFAGPDVTQGLQTTPIQGANILCENTGVLFAVNLKAKRFWQTDPTPELRDEGLELTNVQIVPARCQNCYTIRGQLYTVQITLNVRSQGSQLLANASLKSLEDGEALDDITDLRCTRK